MFHPADLPIVHRDDRPQSYWSFVGVRKAEDGRPTFVLPYGFDDYPVTDPDSVSRIFFSIYRALREFRSVPRHHKSGNEDGPLSKDEGLKLESKEGEPVALYSKIPMLEAVLEGYDELRIASVLYRHRRTERIDYSQIHRYLHEAVYLDDDVAFVDEMVLPNAVVTLDETALVQMFCFLYQEVKQALEESTAPEVASQAQTFRSRYLAPDSRLFGDLDGHHRTIADLKELFHEIDRQTRFKDQDYWHFYDAIESFLYSELVQGEDGVHWGITSFSLVWEDMCMVWVKAKAWGDVVYADTARYANTTVGGYPIHVLAPFSPPFEFEFGGKKRYARPDLVRYIHSEGLWGYLDRLFEVTKKTQGVSIKLTSYNGDALKWYDVLKRKLKRSGFREPTGRYGGTFSWVREADVVRAIDELSSHSRSNYKWRIVDFKCVPWTIYSGSNFQPKAVRDIRKQITYEYALQIYAESLGNKIETDSQFCVPTYFSNTPAQDGRDDIGMLCHPDRLHSSLREQDIQVFRVDLMEMLKSYLEQAD